MEHKPLNSPIFPVVLAGGSGSRLWPLSRAAYPKQLLPLTGEKSMLQRTLQRVTCIAGVQQPFLVCNSEHRFLIQDQCQQLGGTMPTICLEPFGRNTAPAIALAALHLRETDPDAIMLVLPADHEVDDIEGFAATVLEAVKVARLGNLVTFGIIPSTPETGYGYIKAGEKLLEDSTTLSVAEFVEKPNLADATRFLDAGCYLWNSGMFVFKAASFLEELQTHRPDILRATEAAWLARIEDLGFVRPGAVEFGACPTESIDYAVMQPTRRAAVVPAQFGWNDVGSWDAIWELGSKDSTGNVTQGDVWLSDTNNSYVNAQSKLVAVIGLDDVVVVETADAVLVMKKESAQKIKELVAQLDAKGRKEHLEHRRVYRPWGWYDGVAEGQRFQVKRIVVEPGKKLSLQMHHHRAEHWIVVSGTAKVTIDDAVTLLGVNQSTYIPLGKPHRLENPGVIPLVLIEVQSGDYLGEDDIVRFEDNYGRN